MLAGASIERPTLMPSARSHPQRRWPSRAVPAPHAALPAWGIKPRRPCSFPVKSMTFTSPMAPSLGSCLLFSMMMTCALAKDDFTLSQKRFLMS